MDRLLYLVPNYSFLSFLIGCFTTLLYTEPGEFDVSGTGASQPWLVRHGGDRPRFINLRPTFLHDGVVWRGVRGGP